MPLTLEDAQRIMGPPPRSRGEASPDLDTLIDELSVEHGVDPTLVRAIMQTESAGNPRAVSPKGAQGLMQLMPATAKQYGVTDPFDPLQNLTGGVKHLKYLSGLYPEKPDLVAAAYNAGEGAVAKHGGIPPFPETQAYVQKVTGKRNGNGAAKPRLLTLEDAERIMAAPLPQPETVARVDRDLPPSLEMQADNAMAAALATRGQPVIPGSVPIVPTVPAEPRQAQPVVPPIPTTQPPIDLPEPATGWMGLDQPTGLRSAEEAQQDPNLLTRLGAGAAVGAAAPIRQVMASPAEGGTKDVAARLGEIFALPFSVPFSALTNSLIQSGAISPQTAEELGKLSIALTPTLLGPEAHGLRYARRLRMATEKAAPQPTVPEAWTTPEGQQFLGLIDALQARILRGSTAEERAAAAAGLNRTLSAYGVTLEDLPPGAVRVNPQLLTPQPLAIPAQTGMEPPRTGRGRRPEPPPAAPEAPPAAQGTPPVETPPMAPPTPPTAQPSTVPERPATIVAQTQAVAEGKKPAVLVPPTMQVVETAEGTVVYDPQQVTQTPEEIKQAVESGKGGEILGYGVAEKPAHGEPAALVETRGPEGEEIQTVVSPVPVPPAVTAAAERVKPEGGTVAVTPPEETEARAQEVVAARQAETPPLTIADADRIMGAEEGEKPYRHSPETIKEVIDGMAPMLTSKGLSVPKLEDVVKNWDYVEEHRDEKNFEAVGLSDLIWDMSENRGPFRVQPAPPAATPQPPATPEPTPAPVRQLRGRKGQMALIPPTPKDAKALEQAINESISKLDNATVTSEEEIETDADRMNFDANTALYEQAKSQLAHAEDYAQNLPEDAATERRHLHQGVRLLREAIKDYEEQLNLPSGPTGKNILLDIQARQGRRDQARADLFKLRERVREEPEAKEDIPAPRQADELPEAVSGYLTGDPDLRVKKRLDYATEYAKFVAAGRTGDVPQWAGRIGMSVARGIRDKIDALFDESKPEPTPPPTRPTLQQYDSPAERKWYKDAKARLTKALNAKDWQKVIAEADAFTKHYEDQDFPMPDDWARWQRAKDDAEFAIQRAQPTEIGKPLAPTRPLPGRGKKPAGPAIERIMSRGAGADQFQPGDVVSYEGREYTVADPSRVKDDLVLIVAPGLKRFVDGRKAEIVRSYWEEKKEPAPQAGPKPNEDDGIGETEANGYKVTYFSTSRVYRAERSDGVAGRGGFATRAEAEAWANARIEKAEEKPAVPTYGRPQLTREALDYVKGIKNADKRTYATDYIEYLTKGGDEPARPKSLGFMAAQSVRMRLADLMPLKAEKPAKPETAPEPRPLHGRAPAAPTQTPEQYSRKIDLLTRQLERASDHFQKADRTELPYPTEEERAAYRTLVQQALDAISETPPATEKDGMRAYLKDARSLLEETATEVNNGLRNTEGKTEAQTPAPEAPAWTPKIGDTVRSKASAGFSKTMTGVEGRITHIQRTTDGKEKIKVEGFGGPHWNQEDFDLVRKEPEAPRPLPGRKAEQPEESKSVQVAWIDKAGDRIPTTMRFSTSQEASNWARSVIDKSEIIDRFEIEPSPDAPTHTWSQQSGKAEKIETVDEAIAAAESVSPLTTEAARPTLEAEESADVSAGEIPAPSEAPRPDGAGLPGALGEVPAQDVRQPGSRRQPRGRRPASVPADRAGDQGTAEAGPVVPGGEERRPGGVDVSPGRGEQPEPAERPAAPEREPDVDLPAEGDGAAQLHNYRITETDNLGKGGKVAKYNDNVAAIRLLKQLEQEGRLATPAEQAVLVKYVGWGGLPEAFDPDTIIEYGEYRPYTYTRPVKNQGEVTAWQKRKDELHDLLTPEEYEAARRSTLNAHYTSQPIIEAIWSGIQRLGFKRGRVLEPGAGIGHFIGLMPPAVAKGSSISAVELDSLTGRILKQLYQLADVRVQGFEAAQFPDGWFDVVAGNWPFGSYKPFDPRYQKLNLRIHNYFTVKALDLVKPGGLVAFITSTGTLDSLRGITARKLMQEKAVFLGAVRLPSSAFKENALTEVTTDIIFLQKRGPGVVDTKIPFTNIVNSGVKAEIRDPESKKSEWRRPMKTVDLTINEYFKAHPEHVLGEMVDDKLHPGRLSVRPREGLDLPAALTQFMETLPANVVKAVSRAERAQQRQEEAARIPAPKDLLEGSLTVRDGKVYRKHLEDLIEEPSLPKDVTPAKVDALTDIRGAVREVFRTQTETGTDAKTIQAAMRALNQRYDAFQKQYGYINQPENSRAFWRDPDLPSLLALEQWDPDTETATKAAIFRERTIAPAPRAETASDPQHALLISLDETGRLDFDRMAELTGESVASLQKQLRGLIYETPAGTWETADEYLSGNVREKLRQAEAAAKADRRFAENVEALQKVQPADLPPSQIKARLGAPWIPVDDVRAFVSDLLHLSPRDIRIQHSEQLGSWKAWIEGGAKSGRRNVASTKDWGTDRRPAIDLIAEALNGTMPTVYDKVGDKSVINQQETAAARDKMEQIKERFSQWIWEDPDRADRLARDYNRAFNHTVWRKFDGAHLTLPGKVPDSIVTLRPHQKDAIFRILTTGRTLLDHVVGSGKTFTMVASAMELRRSGLAKKPLMVVPNHRLGATAGEWKQLYPAAKILVAEAEDFEAHNRKVLMAKIATGDWDGIIVPESSFVRLPVSTATQRAYIHEEIASLRQAILESAAEEGKNDNRIIKQLEAQIANLEGKLQELLEDAKQHQDVGLTWEQLGVDMLFVDEAHHYKNLFFATRKRRIAGLGQGDAQRATDMYLKIRHLLERNNGRGVVFATGTPISNTIAEMFTVLRYLAPKALQAGGIHRFDPWAAMFADERSDVEFTADGRFRQRTRLSRFTNLPELLRTYRDVADVVGKDDVKLPLPRLESHTITVPMSKAQESFFRQIAERVDAITGPAEFRPDPADDNMLKVSTDGRKSTLDMRLIDPAETDFAEGKINRAADEIARIYKETADRKATQFVFMDLGTPGEKKVGFDLYADLRKKLIKRGVKRDEIAFIQEAKTDEEKQAIIRRMNGGAVRVLVGSTPTMGEGTNAQRRAVVLHHIDPPWKPAEIEQRVGRLVRQGNIHHGLDLPVHVYTYITEGHGAGASFDAYMWQALESKAKFIDQVRKGDLTVREMDDVSDFVLSSGELKALATGNPLAMEQAKLMGEVRRLSMLEAKHTDDQLSLRREAVSLPEDVAYHTREREKTEAAVQYYNDHKTDDFAITIDGKTYTDRDQAGNAFEASVRRVIKLAVDSGVVEWEKVGTYAGATVEYLAKTRESQPIRLRFPNGVTYAFSTTSIAAIEANARNVKHLIDYHRDKIAAYQERLKDVQARVGKPFDHAKKLSEAAERLARINRELLHEAQEGDVAAETPGEAGDEGASIGPGAAAASEFQPAEPFVTSTKHAVKDAEREARGLERIEKPETFTNQAAWDEAKRQLNDDPDIQDRLVNELVLQPRALTPVENALLLHQSVGLINERNDLAKQLENAVKNGFEERADQIRIQVERAEAEIAELEKVIHAVGTESGRSLQARRMMADQDYSLVSMEARKRIAKGGEPLTAAEREEIKQLHDEIAKLQAALTAQATTEQTAAAERQATQAVQTIKEKVAKEQAKTPAEKPRDLEAERKVILAGLEKVSDDTAVEDLRPWIQKLAESFVAEGITERDPLIDAVHNVLIAEGIDLTRRQTMDAISGFGDFKPLNPDPIKTKLRDLKGQMQQVAKLENIASKQPIPKTGVERRVPSDEERRLIQAVEEAKRRFGVVVTDPESQLKSALDALKTRLTHEIADLEWQIANKTKITKTKSPTPTDPAVEALRAQREALKTRFDELFGVPTRELTPEQRTQLAIKAAEKSIADLEARIKAGDIAPRRILSRTPVTPELVALRARQEALREQLQELRDIDVRYQEQRALRALEKSIAEYERRITEGDLAPKPTAAGPDTPAVKEARARRDMARAALEAVRESTGYYDAARIQRALQSLEEANAELLRKIKAHDLSPAAKGAQTPDTAEIRRARVEHDFLAGVLREMRAAEKPKKTPEEIALQTLKTRMAHKLADLERRLQDQDFTVPPRRDVRLDAEGQRLRIELDRLTHQFKEGLVKDRLARRTTAQKILAGLGEAFNVSRILMTSYDLSAVLRQGGWISAGHPLVAAKVFPSMFKALRSAANQRAVMDEILTRTNAPLYHRAKLYFSDQDTSLSRMEEAYMSRWAEKIPGIGASQRAYTTFLNRLRADTFDVLVRSWQTKGDLTIEKAKAIANYINVATGRGKVGAHEAGAVGLNTVFFSPRYLASRFQLLAGQPLYHGTAQTRKKIAGEYGRFLMGLAAVYALAMAADADIETDPRSSDFGKIRFGKTRLDPLGGLLQVTTLLTRIVTGQTKTLKGNVRSIRGPRVKFGQDDTADVVARFLRTKLSPNVGAAIDVLTGRNVVGEPVTPLSAAGRAATPLAMQDIYEALREQGATKGTALGILSIFGMGLQTYEARKKGTSRSRGVIPTLDEAKFTLRRMLRGRQPEARP